MTTKKAKPTAKEFKEIKLSDTAKADDFIDICVDVPEDMSEFFDKHHKTMLPRILPLLVTMKITGQPLFLAKFAVGDKYYNFGIEECAAPDTTLN